MTSGANVVGTNSITSDKGISLAAGSYTINGVEISVAAANTALTTADGVKFNLSSNTVTHNAMTFNGNGTATINSDTQIYLTGGAIVSGAAVGQAFTFNGSGTYQINGKTVVTLNEGSLSVAAAENGLTIGNKTFSVTGDDAYRINVDASGNIISVSGIDGGATIAEVGGANSILTSSAGTFTFAQDSNKVFNISGDDSVTFGLTNAGLVESISSLAGTVAGDFTSAVKVNGNEIQIYSWKSAYL